LETFREPREFVKNERYARDREDTLSALDLGSIDEPIVDIIAGFAKIPHCFTLQSCYGHFVYAPEKDHHGLDPIPRGYGGPVRYRIAYIAFCLEDSPRGRAFHDSLARIAEISPDYIQFGSPEWFWEQWVNSYALQVEPIAHQFKDEAILESAEAFQTQKVRNLFFRELMALLDREKSKYVAG
jgi:hypothetical protein